MKDIKALKCQLKRVMSEIAHLQVDVLDGSLSVSESLIIEKREQAQILGFQLAMNQIFAPTPIIRAPKMPFTTQELSALNQQFKSSQPSEIIKWVLSLNKKVIATTNFGPYEAAILHHIHLLSPEMPIICVDHGYNTNATYQFAHDLSESLELNMHYYTPLVTRQRREQVLNGIPSIDDEKAHNIFTDEVKLEPFSRAFDEHVPEVWLTAIRKEQTPHRASLDILTIDENFNCLRVAPFFHWKELDMEEYLVNNDLPIVEDYYDPTKVLAQRECGLHVART